MMNAKYRDDQAAYRYERKFQTSELSLAATELMVRLNPAMFREVYQRRWINNLYLDTWSRDSYHDNMAGSAHDRVKSRIRWYGDILGRIEKPVLELKIKNGLVNRKVSFPLPAFDMTPDISIRTIREGIRTASLPEQLKQDLLKLDLAPANRYQRKYFRTETPPLRLTVDWGLEFWAIQGDANRRPKKWKESELIVIELKHAPGVAGEVDAVSQHFPIRLSRSSKYVLGVERLLTC